MTRVLLLPTNPTMSETWIDFFSNGYMPIVCFLLIFLVLWYVSRKRVFDRHRHNRKKSKKILQKIRSFPFAGQRISYLRTIDPFVFEELLLDAFEAKGFTVKRNKRYTGDQGIDGVLWKEGRKYLIQAKRYKGHINLSHVKDFIALVDEYKCHGIFCHTGRTGKQSRQTVKELTNITILSGESLIDLISQDRQNKYNS